MSQHVVVTSASAVLLELRSTGKPAGANHTDVAPVKFSVVASCEAHRAGCTDSAALNFDGAASVDDGSCTHTTPSANNGWIVCDPPPGGGSTCGGTRNTAGQYGGYPWLPEAADRYYNSIDPVGDVITDHWGTSILPQAHPASLQAAIQATPPGGFIWYRFGSTFGESVTESGFKASAMTVVIQGCSTAECPTQTGALPVVAIWKNLPRVLAN